MTDPAFCHMTVALKSQEGTLVLVTMAAIEGPRVPQSYYWSPLGHLSMEHRSTSTPIL